MTAGDHLCPCDSGAPRTQRAPRAPVPSGRGRLRRSGPPRPGTGSAGRARQGRSSLDLLHAMQFRTAPPPQVRSERPAQRPSASDRDCPLDTARARCLWHAGGTADENDHLARGGDGSQLVRRVRPSSVTTVSWASRECGAAALPVPSGRGRLRRSGPPRPGTDRPAGHGKADPGLGPCMPYGETTPRLPGLPDLSYGLRSVNASPGLTVLQASSAVLLSTANTPVLAELTPKRSS
jgi:hypothetical protein